MAISVGNGVVKNGLVLYLDTSDQTNYLLNSVEVLVVAGGGGGGVCYGGGGGGGGVVYRKNFPVTPGSAITVTVGGGGSNQVNVSGNGGQGGNSSFGSIVATGGGYGGGNCGNVGGPGGSGGGGSGTGSARVLGGSGILGQGFDGETSITVGGGGGGGAGSRGYQRSGGDGIPYSISGQLRYYGGGGTGGGPDELPGGSGGGGMGMTAMPSGRGDGKPNTGGGGGGSIISGTGVSGLGGSGVVIVRYPGPQKASGGDSITQVNGYTIHTFSTVSTTTFTPFTVPVNTGAVYGLQDLSGNNKVVAIKQNGVAYNSSNGGSFVFDGINGTLDCGNDDSLNFGRGSFTVSLWFKRSASATTNLRLLSKAAGTDTANAASAGFSFFGGDTAISFAVNPTATRTIITAASYSLNEWVNVVGLVERGVSMRTYKNGSLVASTSPPDGSVSGTTKLFIGCNTGSNLFWTGEVAHVAIYNKALTETEVQQNFNALRGRFGI